MLVESIREMARAVLNDTNRRVARVLVGRVHPETSKNTSGLRVVDVAGLEIRERPWELTCEVRFEVEG